MSPADQVLALLPEDGSAMMVDLVIERSGLGPQKRGWAALLSLCLDNRAVVQRDGSGFRWARRADKRSLRWIASPEHRVHTALPYGPVDWLTRCGTPFAPAEVSFQVVWDDEKPCPHCVAAEAFAAQLKGCARG